MENEEAVLMVVIYIRHGMGANGPDRRVGEWTAYSPGSHVNRKPARPRGLSLNLRERNRKRHWLLQGCAISRFVFGSFADALIPYPMACGIGSTLLMHSTYESC